MALFHDGMLCPYCRKPMNSGQELVAFTFVGSDDPLIKEIDDGVVHTDCLGQHPKRDEIVETWNKEAKRLLGPLWMLRVTADGRVRHLDATEQAIYRATGRI